MERYLMNRIQATIAGALLSGLAGVPALASTTAITLPHNLDLFSTTGGFVNPEVLVGFNPQPDPPGDNASPDLTNPLDPSITQPGTGTFTILFGMKGPTGDPFSFNATGAPNSDGVYQFFVTGDGSVFKVSFDIGGFNGSWVGFNPQPDPPGFGGSFVGFAFQGDASLQWNVQEGSLDTNGDFVSQGPLGFALVPEPAAVSILGLGLAGIGLARRKAGR
jgi:hypothetical protein